MAYRHMCIFVHPDVSTRCFDASPRGFDSPPRVLIWATCAGRSNDPVTNYDLGYVRRTLQLLEEASQSDLLPQLKQLLSRAGGSAR